MTNFPFSWFFLLAALLWAVSQNAIPSEVYTWKDESGNLHFGDKAAINRINTSAKRIRIKEFNSVKSSTTSLSDAASRAPSESLLSLKKANEYAIADQIQQEILFIKDHGSEQNEAVPENTTPNPAVRKLLNSAQQYSHAGQLDRAASIIERALRLQPDYSKSWQHLAQIYHQQGRYEQAYFLKQKASQISSH